jgi:hypothetical protein
MTEGISRSRSDHFASVLGGISLLLAAGNVYQAQANRSVQAQVAEGQAKLSRAQTLANVDKALVDLMAKAAVNDGDGALRTLLAKNGVTLNARSATATPPTVNP